MEETLDGPARVNALGRRLRLEVQYGDPATAEREVRDFMEASTDLADADRAGLLLILSDALDKLGSDFEADSIRADLAVRFPDTPEGKRLRKQLASSQTGSPR